MSENPLKEIIPNRKFSPVTKKLPQSAFILGSPRSGTTLFRTMLSGHPKLFVPPELCLLYRSTNIVRPEGPHDLGSLATVFARLTGISWGEAVEELVSLRSPAVIYEKIMELTEGRMLVDKTPRYSTDLSVLQRAEEMFEDPLYIWITRHPGGVVNSWKSLYPMFFWGDGGMKLGLSQERIGELTWKLCNENIEKFLSNVPSDRQMTVRYEDVVRDPQTQMKETCKFLKVPFDKMTLTPFDGHRDRMTDVKGGGDWRFGTKTEIVSSLADSWADHVDTTKFDEETKALALRLGYEV